jgi:hypothetical protein
MKKYLCRCSTRTKKWIWIKANSPETAAAKYGEQCHLEYPELVTVNGAGKYIIITTTTWHAKKNLF